MPETQGVAANRRRLRTELRRLREASGLNQADVVRELDWTTSKLIGIENGSVSASVADVRALLGLCRASDDAAAELVDLARTTRERQWWNAYRGVLSSDYRDFIGYEAEATTILQFHPSIVPGLLQTESYIRAILPAVALTPLSGDLLEGLVEVRMRRQAEIMYGGKRPDYTVIVDEAALRRMVGGPEVMRAQLDQLAAVAGDT